MDEIRLKNFRCFRDTQTARLAPLTLLVGENSTGKTSFLAMIRALCDLAYGHRIPDFKEGPYDLGSFDEIAHHRGARGAQAESFEAGFSATHPTEKGMTVENGHYRFDVQFEEEGTIPVPVRKKLTHGELWIDESLKSGQPYVLWVGTRRGTWERQDSGQENARFSVDDQMTYRLLFHLREPTPKEDGQFASFTPRFGSPDLGSEDRDLLVQLAARFGFGFVRRRPFASAPVRSRPHRTYDPSRPIPDPEGNYVPMYLANVFFQDRDKWQALKDRLETFGRSAGLFDEIYIRALGKKGSEPFQVQVRKFGGRLKGPRRNLIDMGYGVSQVLPVVTELLRHDTASIFLLQQPEVHLHPSAAAALGSFFCQVASPDRQVVVETHSDHLIDRVRMDIRDGTSALKPEDVSILFFERGNLEVRVHSLRIDGEGNVVGAPDTYRRFFMEETARDLRL